MSCRMIEINRVSEKVIKDVMKEQTYASMLGDYIYEIIWEGRLFNVC